MPANLPPEYYEAEKRYREAHDAREKIAALEALISTVPKHKGTDKLRADMRRRLSKLREEGARSKKGGRGDLYAVQKEGAAQAALMGFPNAGKSALLKALTNANPVVADYPMSTVMPLPGMMPFEDILIQMVDLPPIGMEATDGWVSGIIRNADVIVMVVDMSDEPEVQAELLMEQLGVWKIEPRGLVVALNKSDAASGGAPEIESPGGRVVSVSALGGGGLEELRAAVFEAAKVIRAYSKEPGKEPDLKRPFTLKEGTTVRELAERIHKDMARDLKYACVWGSVRIQGQRVQRDYVLKDRDIVEIHV